MQTTVLFLVKIALLVLLWLFIALALRALKRDTSPSSPTFTPATSAQAMNSGAQPGMKGIKGKKGPKQEGRNNPGITGVQVTNGPEAGRYVDLTNIPNCSVGRASSCTLPISDDYASSRHARLLRRGPNWFVEDLDSRNGTYLNEQRIDQLEPINRGDTIRVGRTTLHLQ